jgi:hypothetical protein
MYVCMYIVYIYMIHTYIYIYIIYIYMMYLHHIYETCMSLCIYIYYDICYTCIWYMVCICIYIYWWDVHSLLMQRNKCNKADSNLLYSSRQALMQCGLLASTLTMWLVVYSRGQFCNKKWFPGIEKKPSASRKLWLESWQAWPSEITKKYIITNEPGYNLLMRLWSSCSNWLQTPNVCLHYLGLPHLAGL